MTERLSDLSSEPEQLRRRLANREVSALGELFSLHHERLLQFIRFRLDPRLQARLDAEDVMQEAYIDCEKRIGSFDYDKATTAYVWIRMITAQTLTDLHRRHVEAKARGVGREARLAPVPAASSVIVSQHFVAKLASPSAVAMRGELEALVERTLAEIDPIDREILILRHFEEVSNAEAAEIMQLPESTASSRFLRALSKLRAVLRAAEEVDGDRGGPRGSGE